MPVSGGRQKRKYSSIMGPMGPAKKRTLFAPERIPYAPYVKGRGKSAEIKNFELNNTSLFLALSVQGVIDVSEGVGATQRIGSKIQLRSIDVLMNVVTASAAAALNPCSIFLIWDKQSNGAVAAATDIFQSVTTNLNFGQIFNLERFQVLRRFNVNLDAAGGLSKTIQAHVPINELVRYPDATNPPRTNNLLIVRLDASAVSPCVIQYTTRVKFCDA